MKLIVDIPEDSYERVMNPDKFYRDIDAEKIRWAVYKGTPIPDNATNGDAVLEQIRAEIEKPLRVERYADTESAKAQAIALSWCLEVIDKHTKGARE